MNTTTAENITPLRPAGGFIPSASHALQLLLPALLRPLHWKTIYDDDFMTLEVVDCITGNYRVACNKEDGNWSATHNGMNHLKNRRGSHSMTRAEAYTACDDHRIQNMALEFRPG